MADHYFDFRNSFTGEPDDEPVTWTDWDYALVHALQVIEDNTTPNGLLVWDVDNDRVRVDVSKKIDKFEAARDRYTGRKNYKRENGEYFVPDVTLVGGEWPDYETYLSGKIEQALKESET